MTILGLLFVFGSVFVRDSSPLSAAQVSVPRVRVRGQSAELTCRFDLGTHQLYSVKWYRNDVEFYRYLPRYNPPKQSYRLDGVKVDMSKSDMMKVTLHAVTLRSSGQYRCEVSAEAPNFLSTSGEGYMEVIYIPREGPKITGSELVHDGRDTLLLNCTSGKSYPAAVLAWDIDGLPVTNPDMLVDYGATQHTHGLLTSALGLRVPATARALRVRCTARVAPDLLDEEEGHHAHAPHRKEAMLLVRSSSEDVKLNYILVTLSSLSLLCWTYNNFRPFFYT